ncbi:Cof-type HAD-IIB family hydrolase [Caldifermentibacillus hisashii]|uniref:Cof-type HAD-IIB family hydrolase n=1 Tax=Caldifermentibacillus hisashii TaxID=996558 RepID=UPI002E1E2282|nr:Cof-type HAD-IIB family hydrolase [Caldifermentibacillus hisashii]
MKLIAIDMDGTLFSNNHTISENNCHAILKAQRQGHIVTFCSGRALHDIQEIIKKINLEAPIIAGNGAVVFHNKILQTLTIPVHILKKIMDIFNDFQLYYEIYTNKGIFIDKTRKEYLYAELNRLKDDPVFGPMVEQMVQVQNDQNHLLTVSDFSELNLSMLDPYKMYTVSLDEKKLNHLQQRLSERDDISITNGSHLTVEVGNKQVSKGNALLFLANYFQIPQADTVAIGDNLNDLSMFKAAGTSIAMGNATDFVKSHANFETKTNDDDGVAYALEKFVLS